MQKLYKSGEKHRKLDGNWEQYKPFWDSEYASGLCAFTLCTHKPLHQKHPSQAILDLPFSQNALKRFYDTLVANEILVRAIRSGN